MEYLMTIDSRDRIDGSPRPRRLRQVPPETGRFIAMMLAMSPTGTAIEIGTSGGYSTLWLALACREAGRKVITFEIAGEKAAIAAETFEMADVKDVVTLIKGDARDFLGGYDDISFCFLDCEKEAYADCYRAVVPRMVRGGLLVADNVVSHARDLEPFLQMAFSDERVDTMVVPVGKGELVCRKR
jgi:predicted O-methyltransferase YrrM